MTESITIYAPPERNLSPYQTRKAQAPDIVNDQFFASFSDVLDTINPLQHIPIVSSLYREITGDNELSAGARIAGSTLYGGAIGLVSGIINSIVETQTGKDIGGNLFAMLNDNPKTQVASNAATNSYNKTLGLVS